METVMESFREAATRTLTRYCDQIVTCMAKLTDEQIWERDNEHVNSIGNLILHLDGNLGQRVDGLGGAAYTRHRDDEFNATGGMSKAELSERLQFRVNQFAQLIRAASDDRMAERVTIQDNDATVVSQIFKAVEHFALHTGQILMRTKQLTATELGFTTHARASR